MSTKAPVLERWYDRDEPTELTEVIGPYRPAIYVPVGQDRLGKRAQSFWIETAIAAWDSPDELLLIEGLLAIHDTGSELRLHWRAGTLTFVLARLCEAAWKRVADPDAPPVRHILTAVSTFNGEAR